MRCGLAAAIFLVAGQRGSAHRLDEYLQGTIISLEKNRLEAQMTLTPGVAVYPHVITQIDANADGAISEAEGNAYANRVLHELSITLDGIRLTPHLISVQVPLAGEMKEGRGEIQLEFSAELPSGGRNRTLTLENHHENKIAAYQVNSLVPRDTNIRITGQERNFSQSVYRVKFAQTDIGSGPMSLALWFGGFGWLGLLGLFLVKRMGRIE